MSSSLRVSGARGVKPGGGVYVDMVDSLDEDKSGGEKIGVVVVVVVERETKRHVQHQVGLRPEAIRPSEPTP
jgi:hypothetical protein